MAVLDLIAFPSLLLEDDYLVVLQVFENGCADCGPFHYRCADLDLTVVVREQDFVEAQRGTFIPRETVNLELPTLFNLELLTCDFYDCVH